MHLIVCLSLILEIADWQAFVVSLSGVILATILIIRQWCGRPGQPDENLARTLEEWFISSSAWIPRSEGLVPNFILEDYRSSNDEVGRRDNITLLTGTIIVTSSIIILGNAAISQHVYPLWIFALASIGLYSVWIVFLYETSKKCNEIVYGRIRAIEKVLTHHTGWPFGVQDYINERTHGQRSIWLHCVRRIFWYVVLMLLSLAWLLLSVKIS